MNVLKIRRMVNNIYSLLTLVTQKIINTCIASLKMMRDGFFTYRMLNEYTIIHIHVYLFFSEICIIINNV
jgi:hypothetical protein